MTPTPVLRLEQEADAPFLSDVFFASRPELALLPLDVEGRRRLIALQLHAQATDYRSRFPETRFEIVELDGRPVGRLVTGRSPEELRVADIALLPAWRGQGVGSAVLRQLIGEASRAGRPLRLDVAHGNAGALRLYLRLGFAPTGASATHSALVWRPN